VEVAAVAAGVALRDSKDPDGPKFLLVGGEVRAFVGAIKSGVYDS
jgi:hypothetical protein